MFDDGLHNDSTAGDARFGGSWPVPLGERSYNLSIGTSSSDSGIFNIPGEATTRFTTIGPILPAEQAYIDTAYLEASRTQFILLIMQNYGSTASATDLRVNIRTEDPRVETINSLTRPFPDLSAGEIDTSEVANNLSFNYSEGFLPDCTLIKPIQFDLIVSSDRVPYWNSSFDFIANKLATSIVDQTGPLPKKFALFQNYPNPFNPSTRIKFTLPKPETVKIEVYNTLGQRVKILLDRQMKAGDHEIEFNAQNLSSSIYLYRIEAGEFQEVKKMVLIR